MQRFKTHRLWLIIGLGVLPFTPLPMAVQVGLAVGIVVLLMALSAVARNPGTVQGSTGDSGSEGFSHGPWPRESDGSSQSTHHGASGEGGRSDAHSLAHAGAHSSGHGGGAADSGQAADSGGDGGGGDGGGGDGGGGDGGD